MKKRLNILCVLVILILCYSVFETGSMVFSGIEAGTRIGESQNREEIEKVLNAQQVTMIPDDIVLFRDSVFNTKSGSYVPAAHYQMVVSVKNNLNSLQRQTYLLSHILSVVFYAIAIFIFIRIIISINRSIIFSWKNVSRLRWLSLWLILGFISSVIPLIIIKQTLSEVFAMEGYRLSYIEYISILSLVLGVVCLIVAEVFAIGLKMQEEQELTI